MKTSDEVENKTHGAYASGKCGLKIRLSYPCECEPILFFLGLSHSVEGKSKNTDPAAISVHYSCQFFHEGSFCNQLSQRDLEFLTSPIKQESF